MNQLFLGLRAISNFTISAGGYFVNFVVVLRDYGHLTKTIIFPTFVLNQLRIQRKFHWLLVHDFTSIFMSVQKYLNKCVAFLFFIYGLPFVHWLTNFEQFSIVSAFSLPTIYCCFPEGGSRVLHWFEAYRYRFLNFLYWSDFVISD